MSVPVEPAVKWMEDYFAAHPRLQRSSELVVALLAAYSEGATQGENSLGAQLSAAQEQTRAMEVQRVHGATLQDMEIVDLKAALSAAQARVKELEEQLAKDVVLFESIDARVLQAAGMAQGLEAREREAEALLGYAQTLLCAGYCAKSPSGQHSLTCREISAFLAKGER